MGAVLASSFMSVRLVGGFFYHGYVINCNVFWFNSVSGLFFKAGRVGRASVNYLAMCFATIGIKRPYFTRGHYSSSHQLCASVDRATVGLSIFGHGNEHVGAMFQRNGVFKGFLVSYQDARLSTGSFSIDSRNEGTGVQARGLIYATGASLACGRASGY